MNLEHKRLNWNVIAVDFGRMSQYREKMSGDNDIGFVINYGGRFENIGGEVFYVGGKIHFLETEAVHLFKGIAEADIVDLYRQMAWYKLPYEDTKQLKLLCDGSQNFSNMCLASNWMKSVEIYLEDDDGDGHETACSGDVNEEENQENDGSTEEQGNDGSEKEQGNNQETVNVRDNREQYSNHSLESQVNEISDGFVDEEENEAYRNTPPVSDDDEAKDGVAYERWRRGSSELKIMKMFESIKEFKEAVLEYALLGGHNVKYKRWGYDKCEVKCAVKGELPRDWRMYCSYEESVEHIKRSIHVPQTVIASY